MDNKNNENHETTEWKNEDINALDDFGRTLLDRMIYASRSPETVEKIIKAGGKSGQQDGELVDMILERVTSGYHEQISEYGEKSVQNNIENLAILVNNGYRPGPCGSLNELLSNPELFEKYPETMKKILPHDEKLMVKLNSIKDRRQLNENQPEDPLEERLKRAKTTISREESKDRRAYHRFKVGPLKDSPKLGKTGNSSTGEVNEAHKRAARASIEAFLTSKKRSK